MALCKSPPPDGDYCRFLNQQRRDALNWEQGYPNAAGRWELTGELVVKIPVVSSPVTITLGPVLADLCNQIPRAVVNFWLVQVCCVLVVSENLPLDPFGD